MSEIFIGISTLVVVAVAIIVIRVLLELRNDLRSVKELTEKTEQSLLPVLSELQKSLESARRVTDNVGFVTDDVKVLSTNVRRMGESLSRVTDIVEGAAQVGAISTIGLKEGVKTAFLYYLKNFAKQKKTC